MDYEALLRSAIGGIAQKQNATHPGRAITVGIAAVICVVAIGKGGQARLLSAAVRMVNCGQLIISGAPPSGTDYCENVLGNSGRNLFAVRE